MAGAVSKESRQGQGGQGVGTSEATVGTSAFIQSEMGNMEVSGQKTDMKKFMFGQHHSGREVKNR